MKVNFEDIEIGNVDAGGGNMYYYNDEPFSGTIVEYNAEGVLIGEISVLNGSSHGKSVLYYDNGQKMEELFQSYSRPYGIFRKWDENGNLIKEIDFGPEYQPEKR
ncbi:toxin-antitoxin system YwqK family antitoxin [Sphingobacterium detergens]